MSIRRVMNELAVLHQEIVRRVTAKWMSLGPRADANSWFGRVTIVDGHDQAHIELFYLSPAQVRAVLRALDTGGPTPSRMTFMRHDSSFPEKSHVGPCH